jgi:hypothetical protein
MTNLTRPPFTDSRRIEALEAAPARWCQVTDVSAHTLSLRSLDGVPQWACDLPLSELLQPWPAIAAATAIQTPEFARHAAQALLATEMPIRVAVDAHGRPHRPAGLAVLRRADGQVRIRLSKCIDNLAEHVIKHLVDEADDLAWTRALARLGPSPLRSHHLRTAARYFQREGDQQLGIDGLVPALWPLVEAYVALTAAALADMKHGEALHLGRAPNVFASAINSLLALTGPRTNPLGMAPGTEQLMTLSPGRLHCVARTGAQGQGPLLWRSTYPLQRPTPGELDKLDETIDVASRAQGFEYVRHPHTDGPRA